MEPRRLRLAGRDALGSAAPRAGPRQAARRAWHRRAADMVGPGDPAGVLEQEVAAADPDTICRLHLGLAEGLTEDSAAASRSAGQRPRRRFRRKHSAAGSWRERDDQRPPERLTLAGYRRWPTPTSSSWSWPTRSPDAPARAVYVGVASVAHNKCGRGGVVVYGLRRRGKCVLGRRGAPRPDRRGVRSRNRHRGGGSGCGKRSPASFIILLSIFPPCSRWRDRLPRLALQGPG